MSLAINTKNNGNKSTMQSIGDMTIEQASNISEYMALVHGLECYFDADKSTLIYCYS